MRHRFAAVLLLLTPLSVAAQELESLAGIRLNFERPGARALAMGGATAGNPADLAGAARSFSLEARRTETEGRYFGDAELNTIGMSTSTNGITSAALTVPFGRVTWTASYEVPLDVERSTLPFVQDLPNALPATLPIDASLRLERYTTGGAWSTGPLAFGAAVRYDRLKQRTTAQVPYALAETTDDTDLTYSAGARWKLSDRASIGAAYESGGAFAGERTFPEDDDTRAIELRTPSSLRAGVAIDVLPQLTLAADAVRVNYSGMNHAARVTFPDQSELGYADVTELHAGVEYRRGSVALRAGWWRDPAHAFAIQNGVTPPPPFEYVGAIVNEDEDHVTAGIGLGSGAVRLDASVDRGTHSTRAAIGLTTRF